MKPLISVIIPFYNCSYVDQAITSVLQQDYPNVEIIVVDDGSTNDYIANIQPYMNIIKYIYKRNGGTATALNKGIEHARGDYICWLSSDDVFLQGKIGKQYEWMIANHSNISFTSFYTMNSEGMRTSGPIQLNIEDQKQLKRILKRRNLFNGSTVMLKKEVFEQIGLFNEDFRYTHDYEFWLRASQKYVLGYIKTPFTSYRIHEKMGTKRFKKEVSKEVQVIRQTYAKE
ncbi:glycosyltransferase family 2 protein [Bacillus kwashiorkori]|uniref:glycosyltransferase family 2 protein n=1 Tax=Bacillus kwashiorkori TaxID=1522318 RepID=UPI000780B726|nr:glycosyltransferase [Bacillus kwashiorkori]